MILTIVIGLASGCVFALVAVGYSLVHRTTGVVNFAQGSFVMLGGLGTYAVLTAGVPYPLAVVAGIALAAAGGLLLWLLVVLPLWRRDSPPFVVILATIVVLAIYSNLAHLAVGSQPFSLPPWFGGFSVQVGENVIDGQYVVVVLLTLLLLGAIGLTLQYSSAGRAMRACAAGRETSRLLGISPERIGLLVLTATAALGGLAGAVITPAQFTSAEVGLTYGAFGFVAAVIGGLGSMSGALVGGVVLGLVQAVATRYVSPNYATVIAFSILLLLLTFRPRGLLGATVP